MIRVLGTYPYLFANVLWLGGLLLAVRSLPLASQRRLLVRLGLLMIPNCLFSLANGDYWNPTRVGGWVLGPEDVLFAFNVAAMGCLPAVWLYRHRLMVAEQPMPRIGRVLGIGIPAQCAYLVLLCMGRSRRSSWRWSRFLCFARTCGGSRRRAGWRLRCSTAASSNPCSGCGRSSPPVGEARLRGGCCCSESPWARLPGRPDLDSSGRFLQASRWTSAFPARIQLAERISSILAAICAELNGFWRNAAPGSRIPCCTIAFGA